MSIEVLRGQYAAARCHHVFIPGFFGEHTGALREQVDAASFQSFDVPDRGHYEHTSELAIPALFDDLRAIAEQVTTRALTIVRARWLRLRHRDYQLMKDDGRDRPVAGAHVEVMFDFSAQPTGTAEVVYTDGYESWVVPQVPAMISIVGREPWLYRYQRYLNVALAGVTLHRLYLSLAYLDDPAPSPAAAG